MAAETHEPIDTRTVAVHLAANRGALRAHIRRELDDLLGDAAVAVLIHEKDGEHTVELAKGDCPLALGDRVDEDAWEPESGTRLPLHYGERAIGTVIVSESVADETKQMLGPLLAHYTAALVNLMLKDESLRNADHYCAALQAFEEGVVLFQEQNPEAIGARFLDLCATALRATAGAVFVLAEINDLESELRLEHTLGLPDWVLDTLTTADGDWWPQDLLRGQMTLRKRDPESGEFDGFQNDSMPPALSNVLGAPLRYHGVHVGVCLLFNIELAAGTQIDGMQRLFELGAAVFHRRELEAQSMRTREIQTQLEIASTIQKRLIPTEAPRSPLYEFAWSSRPAQFVGGDYVDLLDAHRGIVAVLADVSGHGINSALLMTSFRAAFRAEALELAPHALLTSLNGTVKQEVGDTAMFLTAVAVRFNHCCSGLQLSSAGHNPVYLYRAEEDRFEVFDSSGPPLGFFDGVSYEVAQANGKAGDLLVLYTDGVVEATDHRGREMFEVERLRDIIRRRAHEGPTAVRDAILESVHEFSGDKTQEDDISLLVVRFL